MDIIKKLPREMILSNGIRMVLDTKIHSGINDLNDIHWYEYSITNKEKLNIQYNNVCLSGFVITEEIRKEAEGRIIENNVSMPECIRPHIDYNTGNIHPSKKYIEENDNGDIKQIVLCSGLGPITSNIEVDDAIYFYKNTPRQRACKIHKACYFPLIEENDDLKSNWRYKMLAEIWKIIQNALAE